MTNGKITLSFVHPTNSGDVLTAEVSTTATPEFLVDQMVQAGWLPKPAEAGQYKLRNAQTGVQLLDGVDLVGAGVTDGTTLGVDHATSGAGW